MQEELISYITAKLAKEKGFDVPVDTYLTEKNKDVNRKLKMRAPLYNFNQLDNIFSRPTQSLLQRWLREVHNIDVYCIPWVYENKTVYDFFINYKGESRAYSSYEEALEVGLQEALKLIN